MQGIRAAVEEAAASARPEAALAGTTALPGALGVSLREADETIRAVDRQIAAAQKRRVRLRAAGASTEEVDREIVDLRRKRREGGQLHVGEELSDGRYLLLERIGRGGFATVWRALDAGRGDLPVAIKVLHPNLAGDESRQERFFRGARAMAELDHPGVVRILDPKGEDSGWHYFVMELVHGEDVHSAVVGKRLPAERVIPMLLSAGEAISFAHGKGLVHRDVKPANILLDGEGLPRITDFDLVWARDTTGGTRSGALGTFLYAAPELMHRPQDADARADVYGLGMTAVFCLHGGELPPIMMRYPGRVLERLPCSDAMRKVLERAIEFEASERFPDVAAFCEALRGAVGSAGGVERESSNSARVEDEPRQQAHESARRVAGVLKGEVRRDLEEGGPIRRAIIQTISGPRAGRVQEPVTLADWTVTAVAAGEVRAVVTGSWSLVWPERPDSGAAEGSFQERGTFRCGVRVEEFGGLRPYRPRYRSDFFEALLPWVEVPGGVFLMGSPEGDTDAHEDERPQRRVEVTAFALTATPVTVRQYAAVLGGHITGGNADQPITMVSWEDAIKFCNAFSQLAGRHRYYALNRDRRVWAQDNDGIRLPDEAEWEYACRAGTTTRYFFGDDERQLGEYAWYRENGGGRASPVGMKKASPWNLHDMHGNVLEWTWDEYPGRSGRGGGGTAFADRSRMTAMHRPPLGARVVRGGSFIDAPTLLRSAQRTGAALDSRSELIGFRCAGPARRRGFRTTGLSRSRG
ncbi:bifunctional serine/threonine-protein kinase/formylglycine-generating enzyme family protein [Sorangium sp. So ce295]|uniref:bifunctional serine/threonine-protein kinase/formylglycine-generating enzyme family protein n=1 Tax=Sorangium sp. So ce295 TaxID=3133295 RepID=UPI003F606FD6